MPFAVSVPATLDASIHHLPLGPGVSGVLVKLRRSARPAQGSSSLRVEVRLRPSIALRSASSPTGGLTHDAGKAMVERTSARSDGGRTIPHLTLHDADAAPAGVTVRWEVPDLHAHTSAELLLTVAHAEGDDLDALIEPPDLHATG